MSRSRVNYDAQYVFQTGHAPYQESPNKTSFSRVAGIGSDSGQSSLWRLGIDIDGPREVPLQARHVERLLPFCDDDRRDAVADQIGQRPSLGHEAVDAENQRDAGHGDRTNARQRRREDDEATACYARCTF